MCKSLSPTATYQAGARGWLWIKLKRDYRTELADTVDLVVVGALAGRRRRRGVYGALLLACYDPATDRFQTLCKCGTGFADAELAALPQRLAPLARVARPARIETLQGADVWFAPAVVVEVVGAELTHSPHHTAGWGKVKPDSGLALRFPRFTGRWRDDKAPRTPPPSPNWSRCTSRPAAPPLAREWHLQVPSQASDLTRDAPAGRQRFGISRRRHPHRLPRTAPAPPRTREPAGGLARQSHRVQPRSAAG